MSNILYKSIAVLCLATLSQAASAYAYYTNGGVVEKWGSSNTPGTPGGTITWGFMPAGTSGSAFCGDYCPGTSLSSINIENSPGTGFTLTPLSSLTSTITAAINKWTSVANITVVGPNADTGLAINDPNAAQPEIRIGVFTFSPNHFGGAGFAPPPNILNGSGTGAGDIMLDFKSFYAFQPGNNGDLFWPGGPSNAPNDIESLILHELGHALGLDHPVYDGTCAVMQNNSACDGHINKVLTADDIAGIQFLYGAAPVPLPAAVWTFGTALFGVLWLQRKRNLG